MIPQNISISLSITIFAIFFTRCSEGKQFKITNRTLVHVEPNAVVIKTAECLCALPINLAVALMIAYRPLNMHSSIKQNLFHNSFIKPIFDARFLLNTKSPNVASLLHYPFIFENGKKRFFKEIFFFIFHMSCLEIEPGRLR